MRFNRGEFVACIFLVVATLCVYWKLPSHDFVNYDDPKYVTENNHVQAGLTGEGIIWAFTSSHAKNWHPMTWLSHMLDCQIYELNAGGHHLTSLLFHIINALLVFVVFKRTTKAFWQSAFVAALFALHPLHVESVAWVAERKDVLSALFWMLTIWAYVLYVERPGLARYLLVFLFFILGLMAKPMLVTLPFVLLLMDYWPLKRFMCFQSNCDVDNLQSDRPKASGYHGSFTLLVLEKAPLFVLAAVSSTVTFLVQQAGGAVKSLDVFPLQIRFANALVSYVIYIWKFILPLDLAVFYPHPGMPPIWLVTVCLVLLFAVSVLVFRYRYRCPYLVTGWLWYVGTLVPVIGVVQAGTQSMADRYTYVPLIGLFVVIAWGVNDLAARWSFRRFVLTISACGVLLAFTICTWLQVSYWRNSITLFEHAIEVTSNNNLAHYNLGNALVKQGKLDEGIANYLEAMRIEPDHPDTHNAHNSIGLALFRQDKLDEAIAHYSKAIRLKPDYVQAHNNLGVALIRQGKVDEAIRSFSRALQIRPDHDEASYNLGLALRIMDKTHDTHSIITESQ